MNGEILKLRERAFEYEYFHRMDQELLNRMRERLEAEERRESLRQSTGVDDSSVLKELDDHDMSTECLLALALYPLVHIAWCDGKVDERERIAVLDAARSVGYGEESASFQLLESWLKQDPGDEMLTVWEDYIRAFFATISPVAQRVLARNILARSSQVASAAGGLMGIHAISRAEKEAFSRLNKVLEHASQTDLKVEQ